MPSARVFHDVTRRRLGVTRGVRPGKCAGVNSFLHDAVAFLPHFPIKFIVQATRHGRIFLGGVYKGAFDESQRVHDGRLFLTVAFPRNTESSTVFALSGLRDSTDPGARAARWAPPDDVSAYQSMDEVRGTVLMEILNWYRGLLRGTRWQPTRRAASVAVSACVP